MVLRTILYLLEADSDCYWSLFSDLSHTYVDQYHLVWVYHYPQKIVCCSSVYWSTLLDSPTCSYLNRTTYNLCHLLSTTLSELASLFQVMTLMPLLTVESGFEHISCCCLFGAVCQKFVFECRHREIVRILDLTVSYFEHSIWPDFWIFALLDSVGKLDFYSFENLY